VAHTSHKRDTNARLFSRTPRATTFAGSLAVLATASAVSLGVLTTPTGLISAAPSAASLTGSVPEAVSGPIAGDSTEAALDLAGDLDRRLVTRSSGRPAIGTTDASEASKKKRLSKAERLVRPAKVRAAIRGAETEQFTTTVLNLWTAPGDEARKTGVIDTGKKVVLTGRSFGGRDEIVTGKKQTRWVTSGYFSAEKPVPAEPAEAQEPAVGGSCTNGTSVSPGVSPNIVKVHAAVCAAFPSITTYGTLRSDGEHAQGIAVDIMLGTDIGYQVADFIRANAAELGVNYLIYYQRIWSVDRGGEGWRGMEDRGSVTANHQDHVHVTTY